MIFPKGNDDYNKLDTQGETVTTDNKVATTKTTKKNTQKPRKIAHTLCSQHIKFKIRECTREKYLCRNVFLTSILNRTIHQPLLPLRPAVRLGQQSTAILRTLLCRGYACPICNRSMVDMARAWRMLDNEISRTPMPEEYNNFYVKVDFVTILLFVLFFLFFFFCDGALSR